MPRAERAQDGVRLRLDRDEAAVLRRVADDLAAFLAGRDPDDPVARRLFPDAYEDAEAERSYRSLTADDLDRTKREALEIVRTDVTGEGRADVILDDARIDAWLRALTDIRLALGTRLDVDEEAMGRTPSPGDPDAAALSVLHWLGYLQEIILEAAGP